MSRRWIIRGTCLGLFGLCVGLWGLSYFYNGHMSHVGRSYAVMVNTGGGTIRGLYSGGSAVYFPTGWSVGLSVARGGRPRMRDLLGEVFPGFAVEERRLGGLYVEVPLWCPAALLALGSWIVWRRTRKPARGFPVEPQAAGREIAGGEPSGMRRGAGTV